MIDFVLKPRKLASAIAYMVQQRPGLTKKQICKLLFFADKGHLLLHGRTITGDRYFALEQGPIPTHGLDAMNGKGEAGTLLSAYGKLRGWVFELEHAPDLKPLSESDLSVIDETLERLGHLPAWKLEELTHEEPAWKETAQNGPIDFELFFSGHPEAELVKTILLEENRVLAVEAR